MGGAVNLERHGGVRRSAAFWMVAVSGLLACLLLLHGDRLRWYRVVYWLAYQLGLTVWRRPSPPDDLVALVEGPSRYRPGVPWTWAAAPAPTPSTWPPTAGTSPASTRCPKRWPPARRGAAAAGVAPRLVHGDVTRLHDLGVGSGYTLLVDFGCFHTLPEDRRAAYVAGVSDAAAAGATLLLYGFTRPPRAAPMHAGVTTDEVQQRFSRAGWELINAERTSAAAIRPTARRAADRFELWRYQLRRRSA